MIKEQRQQTIFDKEPDYGYEYEQQTSGLGSKKIAPNRYFLIQYEGYIEYFLYLCRGLIANELNWYKNNFKDK